LTAAGLGANTFHIFSAIPLLLAGVLAAPEGFWLFTEVPERRTALPRHPCQLLINLASRDLCCRERSIASFRASCGARRGHWRRIAGDASRQLSRPAPSIRRLAALVGAIAELRTEHRAGVTVFPKTRGYCGADLQPPGQLRTIGELVGAETHLKIVIAWTPATCGRRIRRGE